MCRWPSPAAPLTWNHCLLFDCFLGPQWGPSACAQSQALKLNLCHLIRVTMARYFWGGKDGITKYAERARERGRFFVQHSAVGINSFLSCCALQRRTVVVDLGIHIPQEGINKAQTIWYLCKKQQDCYQHFPFSADLTKLQAGQVYFSKWMGQKGYDGVRSMKCKMLHMEVNSICWYSLETAEKDPGVLVGKKSIWISSKLL